MSIKDLGELFEEKKYKEIISIFNHRIDTFERLSLDEFLLWSRCYEHQGDFESALYILSLCYIEEINDRRLDNEYERLTVLQDRVFQAILQLKSGIQDSEDIDFLIKTMHVLVENNVEDVLVAYLEDIFRVTKHQNVKNPWLGKLSEDIFFKLDDQLVLTSNQKNSILDSIIYYYISSSKVYDGKYAYIRSIRNNTIH
ncbi:hypothetical protein [Flammeovirga sp. SJP92]|uniref:hypothetical protein n=1 Tax=Flammeovirga sp. SJP92 TaxID=1775430 RepID=UPI000786CE12|nr:hypothetical protein [Flammeovirga sp. SJP92]KXX66976.1 hypothetical protein AVL50_28800 [Flammeovirga sp. SJP92]